MQPTTVPSQEQGVTQITTTCCIVGGGPGGALLAFMLARHGISVTLLEAHMDGHGGPFTPQNKTSLYCDDQPG
jgi:cation diffusion facilitator CzcD-associated flavoprotein CzcO